MITSEYYTNVLNQIDAEIREKRPGLKKKKFIFHQDSTPAHKTVLVIEKLLEFEYDLFGRSSYSTDRVPLDLCAPKQKKKLSGKVFASTDEGPYMNIISVSEQFFREELLKLEKRCTMFVEVNEDYVEK